MSWSEQYFTSDSFNKAGLQSLRSVVMFCPALVKGLPVQAIFLTPEPVRSITPWPFLKDSIFTWTFSLYLGRKQESGVRVQVLLLVICMQVSLCGFSRLLIWQSTGFLLKSLGFPRRTAVRFPLCFAEIFPRVRFNSWSFPRVLQGFLLGFHFKSPRMFWLSSCYAGVFCSEFWFSLWLQCIFSSAIIHYPSASNSAYRCLHYVLAASKSQRHCCTSWEIHLAHYNSQVQ